MADALMIDADTGRLFLRYDGPVNDALYDEFLSRARDDVRYLFNGELYAGACEMIEQPRRFLKPSYAVYGSDDNNGPAGESLSDMTLYMEFNMDTEAHVKDTFNRLSVDDKRRVMAAAPQMRDRAFTLRASAARAAATSGEGRTVGELVGRSNVATRFVDRA